MSIKITIKEAGNSFFVQATLETGENRVVTVAHFDPDAAFESDDNSRESKLQDCICYVHGMSEGMNLMRSIMPLVTYSATPEKV